MDGICSTQEAIQMMGGMSGTQEAIQMMDVLLCSMLLLRGLLSGPATVEATMMAIKSTRIPLGGEGGPGRGGAAIERR